MSSSPIFPPDIWRILFDRIEPFLLVLLPCVCKGMNGKFIVSNLSSLRLAKDTALLPGMHPRRILKSLLNHCKRNKRVIRLSHIYVNTPFSLDSKDVQKLIKLAAPTLKSFKTSHSLQTHVWLRMDASRIEKLDLAKLDAHQAVPLLTRKLFTALRCITIRCFWSDVESSKKLLHALASLSPPRLEKVEIMELSFKEKELLPHICKVAQSHCKTLRKFSVDCNLVMPWMKVKETCLELFHLPPHQIRHNRKPLFLYIIRAHLKDPTVWETIAVSLFDQIIAAIPSPRDQAREIYCILRDLAPIICVSESNYKPFLSWILPRLESHRLIDPDIVGRDAALRIVGVLALCLKKTGTCASEIDEQVVPILERFRNDESRVGTLMFRSSAWARHYSLMDTPFWKKLFVENLNSPESVLRRCVVDMGQLQLDILLVFLSRLTSDTVDLWIQNEQGCTLLDQILLRGTPVLEMILSIPPLNAQLFQRLTAAQVGRMYSNMWIKPSTSLRSELLFPARLFEIVEAADSDATLEAMFAFYYRRIRYKMAMDFKEGNVPLREQKPKFLDLYKAAVPSPSVSMEKRFRRFLDNEPPFDTLADEY